MYANEYTMLNKITSVNSKIISVKIISVKLLVLKYIYNSVKSLVLNSNIRNHLCAKRNISIGNT